MYVVVELALVLVLEGIRTDVCSLLCDEASGVNESFFCGG